MYYKYLLTILVGILLFSSCKGSKDEIDYIDVLYHNTIFGSKQSPEMRENLKASIPDFTSPYSERGIFPVKITDSDVLKQIQAELVTLTPQDKYLYPDVRIMMDVHYKDGSVKHVDFCGVLSDAIFVDGKRQAYNNRLAYIVKNNVGLYGWIKDDATFKLMPEIKDTTIVKEPLIEGYWYREYLMHKVILDD